MLGKDPRLIVDRNARFGILFGHPTMLGLRQSTEASVLCQQWREGGMMCKSLHCKRYLSSQETRDDMSYRISVRR